MCVCVWLVRVCLQNGYLPLHWAANKEASEAVVRALLDAHPQGAKEKEKVRDGLGAREGGEGRVLICVCVCGSCACAYREAICPCIWPLSTMRVRQS